MPQTDMQTRDATHALAYRAEQAGFEAVFPDADTPCDRCNRPLGSAIYRVACELLGAAESTRYICDDCYLDFADWWLWPPGSVESLQVQPEPIPPSPTEAEGPQSRWPRHQ